MPTSLLDVVTTGVFPVHRRCKVTVDGIERMLFVIAIEVSTQVKLLDSDRVARALWADDDGRLYVSSMTLGEGANITAICLSDEYGTRA